MKKQSKRKPRLQEVIITGLSDYKQSNHGGRYRYIWTKGMDPASLYEEMRNAPAWQQLVTQIETYKELLCMARIKKTRDGKIMINCDTVPQVITGFGRRQPSVRPQPSIQQSIAQDRTTLKDLIVEE